jgi:hypothetical protein
MFCISFHLDIYMVEIFSALYATSTNEWKQICRGKNKKINEHRFSVVLSIIHVFPKNVYVFGGSVLFILLHILSLSVILFSSISNVPGIRKSNTAVGSV